MTRRTRRDLSIDEIIDRAVELGRGADERTLTMSAVADACGVTPMALYHHLPDKEALLTLVADRVMGDAVSGFSFQAEAWEDDVVRLGLVARNAFLAHRTSAQVWLRRPVVSPQLARYTELIFESFHRGGLDGTAVAEAADAFVLLLFGSIANDLTRPPEIRRALPGQHQGDRTLLDAHIEDYADRDPQARYVNALRWTITGMLRSTK